jgi:hypothetical protein
MDARDADGQKVRSTAPQATRWCVVGAVDRALYELLNLDVYDLLCLEVDAYDTAPCPSVLLNELRRPLPRVLGRRDLATTSAAAERLLREAAASKRPCPELWRSPHRDDPSLNAFPEPLEAVYIFPLPPSAAVTRFTITAQDRQVEGTLMERTAAHET